MEWHSHRRDLQSQGPRDSLSQTIDHPTAEIAMRPNLQANFGGLRLASPVIVGACPISMNEQTREALQNAGAGAIVLPSLFEEQVIQWSVATGRSVTERERNILNESRGIHGNLRPEDNWAVPDAESYLSLVNRASSTQPIPIFASLNGFTAGGWMDFAGELQEAGASAIELNLHHTRCRDYESSMEIETTILDAVRDINAAITIPLFVKLGRDFTSIPHIAQQLLSGAQGMVLYGRSPSVDICIDTMKLISRWRLSTDDTLPDYLDTLIQVHGFCPAMPLAASGGISHADHLIKALLAGADVATVTSAVYRDGPEVIRSMLVGLADFMKDHDMQTLGDLQTSRPLEFSSVEQRAAYIAALTARLGASDTLATSTTLQHVQRRGATD